MNIQIKARFSGAVLFEADAPSIKVALELAVKSSADLGGAYLGGADLGGAYLGGADLGGAYLGGADLRGAYLGGADLRGADLRGADLRGADLRGAYLSSAYLSSAYLGGAYLSSAYLGGADLGGADLRGADLRGAYLRGAYLSSAYLGGADLGGADLRGAYLRGAEGNNIEPAAPEVEIQNLDKVREIIIDNANRLEMGYWHSDGQWKNRTCAEETMCETSHCLAGWLQVCSTNAELRELDPLLAGTLAAPIAAKMFFRGNNETLNWLKKRKYVAEIAECEKRAADCKDEREVTE